MEPVDEQRRLAGSRGEPDVTLEPKQALAAEAHGAFPELPVVLGHEVGRPHVALLGDLTLRAEGR